MSANSFDPYLSAKSPSSAFSFLIFHPWGLHPGSPSPRTAAGAGSNLAPGIARYPLAPWPARQPALPIQQQGRRSCPGRCSRSARNQLSLFFSILREWEGEARTRLPATSARVAHRGLIEWRGTYPPPDLCGNGPLRRNEGDTSSAAECRFSIPTRHFVRLLRMAASGPGRVKTPNLVFSLGVRGDRDEAFW